MASKLSQRVGQLPDLQGHGVSQDHGWLSGAFDCGSHCTHGGGGDLRIIQLDKPHKNALAGMSLDL